MNLPSAIEADTSRVSPNSFSSLISCTYLISALDVPTGTYFSVTLLPVISRTSDTGTVIKEVGKKKGSWKGGCIGCSYDSKPGETPEECLKRMEKERKF